MKGQMMSGQKPRGKPMPPASSEMPKDAAADMAAKMKAMTARGGKMKGGRRK